MINKLLMLKLFLIALTFNINIVAAQNAAQNLVQNNDIPAQPNLNAAAYILIDYDTRKVLAEKNPDTRLPVASLNKLMTAYVVMDEVSREQLDLSQDVIISQIAADTEGSTMFLSARTQVPAPDLLKGLVIHSGNDAAVALAEWVGGTEEGFVDLMNKNARILQLNNTLFRNSNGLPTEREQYSTVRDLAILSQHLINKFPEHYELYKERHWKFAGITQPNRNRLLRLDSSVDGIKTGHTNESGYSLISSALRKDMRLIAVVLGVETDSQRIQFSRQLLEYGFRNYYTQPIIDPSEEVAKIPIYGGISSEISAGVSKTVKLTLPRHWFHQYEIKRKIVANHLLAPIREGDKLGTLTLYIEQTDADFTAGKRTNRRILQEIDLVAKQNMFSSGYINRTIARVRLFFLDLFNSQEE